MERKMLTAEKVIDCCCDPTTEEGEHGNTWYISICFPPSVEIVAVIIVQLLKRFPFFRHDFLELQGTPFLEFGEYALHKSTP